MFKKLLVYRTDHAFIQMIRYGLVVAIAAPIDLGGYVLLSSVFNLPYVLAATISFTLSLVVNYILSVNWVWTNHSGRQKRIDATIFALIGVVGLGLTDLLIWIFTDLIGLNYIISKLVTFVFVFFWSFGARRYLFKTDVKNMLPKLKAPVV
jgi:putative flippase GtrA